MEIHLFNKDLENELNSEGIKTNSLKATGYCGNENDHTWGIDSPDNDMSFLYSSKFEYQNDIEKLGLSEDFSEPDRQTNAIKELIETYQRRVKAVTELILGTENTGSHQDTRRFERWHTKKAEYKAIIHELEAIVKL